MKSVLFVCLGNICRSPAAEGILRELGKKLIDKGKLKVDSCGIGDWHIGQLPDNRMREAAKKRGLTLTSRARQFTHNDFEDYDHILVTADKQVLHHLHSLAETAEHKAKVQMVTAFSETFNDENVPDPYYQGDHSFEQVLDMLEDSCQGLLESFD